jgi:phosphomannomutase
MKKLVVFDLDGTLAESKSMVDDEMVTLLYDLLRVAQVAVISGGDWPQFEAQMLSRLPQDERLRRLSLLPTCGTKFLRYEGAWRKEYSEDLSEVEKALITGALQDAVAQVAFEPDQLWGEQIEDRGSQITFSALGQQAPLAAKRDWDPDFTKRKQIQAILEGTLSEFSVRMGGTTSIDVTKVGIDKAYGIRKLREILEIEVAEMIFVGDALFPGGNDYPAKEAGVASIQVSGPTETKRVIEAIVACLDY